MDIGKRIRMRRKELDLSQDGVAAVAGISQGALSLLERGNSKIPMGTTLTGLAKVLKTTPAWIMKGRGRPEMPSVQSEVEEEILYGVRSLADEKKQLVADFVRMLQDHGNSPSSSEGDSDHDRFGPIN